ncbi:MAG: hypothetical protein KDB22_20970 [Planctomycetales bacterium]|nr:hypothetical protein [Planctomycetales bacterium]
MIAHRRYVLLMSSCLLFAGCYGRGTSTSGTPNASQAQAPTTDVDQLRKELTSQVIARLGNDGQSSYESLRAKIESEQGLSIRAPEAAAFVRREFVANWARSHDPASLEPEAAEWVMMQMLPEYMAEAPAQEINAVWKTSVTVPRSGEYTFSISPLNLTNTREEGKAKYFRLWSTVEIDGKKVLESSSEQWTQYGNPIRLEEGKPASLTFELRYRLGGYGPLPAAGQLFWSGPGIDAQVVAPEYCRLPGSQERGVALSVERVDRLGLHTCKTTVDAIDQVLGKHAIVQDERTLNRYIEHCVGHLLSDDYMLETQRQVAQAHPEEREAHRLISVANYRGVMNKCSSKLRAKVAAELAKHPDVVAPTDQWTMIYFHDSVRYGAERPALDLLGQWLVSQANRTPEPADSVNSYLESNYKPLRHLIIPLLLEHPQSSQWLMEDYLALEDGGCSVASAVVLGYVHSVGGTMDEWIGRLDERLTDEEVTGDTRVNWLIARNFAEEIRQCRATPVYYTNCHHLKPNARWLSEAAEVAQSESTKSRVARERATRLIALEAFPEAVNVISNLASMDDLREIIGDRGEASEGGLDFNEPNYPLINALKRRRSRSEDEGNLAAMAGYGQLLDKLQREELQLRQRNSQP